MASLQEQIDKALTDFNTAIDAMAKKFKADIDTATQTAKTALNNWITENGGATGAGTVPPPVQTPPVQTPLPPISTPKNPATINLTGIADLPVFISLETQMEADYGPEGIIPPLVKWFITDPSVGYDQQTELYAFNIAYVWTKLGTYDVRAVTQNADGTVGKTHTFKVSVVSSNLQYIDLPEGDITKILDNTKNPGKAFRLKDGGNYTLTRAVQLKTHLIGVTSRSIGRKYATITYTGAPEVGEHAILLGTGICAGGYKHVNKDYHVNAVQASGGNNFIFGIDAVNVMMFCNLNNRPNRVLLLNNHTDSTLQKYNIWLDGSEIVIVGAVATDSMREHCIRGGTSTPTTPRLCAINYCDLQNLDKHSNPSAPDYDVYNTDKGSLVIQGGRWMYAAHNILRSASGTGPLGRGDGVQTPTNTVRKAVRESEKCTVYNGMQIWHGSIDVRFERCTSPRIELIAKETGYPVDRKIRNVLVRNCAAKIVYGGGSVDDTVNLKIEGTTPPPAVIS